MQLKVLVDFSSTAWWGFGQANDFNFEHISLIYFNLKYMIYKEKFAQQMYLVFVTHTPHHHTLEEHASIAHIPNIASERSCVVLHQ